MQCIPPLLRGAYLLCSALCNCMWRVACRTPPICWRQGALKPPVDTASFSATSPNQCASLSPVQPNTALKSFSYQQISQNFLIWHHQPYKSANGILGHRLKHTFPCLLGFDIIAHAILVRPHSDRQPCCVPMHCIRPPYLSLDYTVQRRPGCPLPGPSPTTPNAMHQL